MNLLDYSVQIHPAFESDLSDIVSLIRNQEKRYAGSLGQPHHASIRKSIQDQHLLIARINGNMVGFVEYYPRSDGWNTVYSGAVGAHWEGMGIGRNLLYSVPPPIPLKRPQFVNGNFPNPATQFYLNAGMKIVGTDLTRSGKLLNVFQLPILAVLVQGSNREIPRVARESGWAYGSRTAETPRDYPFQLDLEFNENWREFDWNDYMDCVCKYRPVVALALDYFEPDQLPTLLAQITDLKNAGVLRVLVCPKFHGAVKDIPPSCTVAVSVPSKYAGFLPRFEELSGRKVHLLGGTPPKWFGSKRYGRADTGLISAINGAGGRVVSVDGNAHTGVAEQGGIWIDKVWDFSRKPLDLYSFAIESGRNIVSDLHSATTTKQLALFT